ncbi:MAG: type II toxin-antitoxin system RatA family toxin [Pseudomonadota bacterium]
MSGERRAKRSALVAYTRGQMYRLVDDVERYPEFLPWCRRAVVHHRDAHGVEATLELQRGGLSRAFTTRNTQSEPEFIRIELAEGPFRALKGEWTFTALGETGCKVELDIRFEFASRILDALLGPFFEETLNSLVEAFTVRAASVYGPPERE